MNVSESEPDPFRAGFAVAFAIEEAAQLRDQEQHLVELRLCRLLDLSAQLRAPNFVGIAEWFGVQIAADSAHTHQISDPPSRDEEQRHRHFRRRKHVTMFAAGAAFATPRDRFVGFEAALPVAPAQAE